MPRQSGFSVLTLLMLVAAMLTGLTFVLIGSGPNIQGQISAQTTAQLVAQANLIVHRISKCATDYPNGNNGTLMHPPYPVDAMTGPLAAALLVCPGSGQNLWSGVDGVYLPAPITGFSGWTYTNNSIAPPSPAMISIQTLQPASYAAAIASAATKIGVAATASGDTLTIKVIK